MDRQRFVVLMRALAAQWRVDVTEPWLQGYWIGCGDLEDAAFEAGVHRALRECDRMPSAHELRMLSGEEEITARAMIAWPVVLRAISAVGSYESVDFGLLVNAVLRTMGGWVELCSREGDDLREWGRKEFERTYKILSRVSALSNEIGAHLPGIHERANKALGAAPRPVPMLDAKRTAIAAP